MTSTLAGLAPARQFGPWALELDPAERLARLRSFRALARVLAGPRAGDLVALLAQAETDPAALVSAADALDRLPSVDMRRIVGSYAGLTRPLPPVRRGVRAYPRPSVRVTPRPDMRPTADIESPAKRRAGRG